MFQLAKMKVAQSCLTLRDTTNYTIQGILQARTLEWVAFPFSRDPLLQGIFPTQGSNPGLPHCRRILYQLSHKGSPRILESVAYPLSSGSSQPRIELGSMTLQVDSLQMELSGKPFQLTEDWRKSPLSPKHGMAGYLPVAPGIWHYSGCSFIQHPWEKHFWVRDSLQTT